MSKMPKVIGEGSYGCVHRPSLKCKNKKISYKKKVSKILLNKHALKEMHQYLRIAQADKNAHYYLGKPIKCKLLGSKENIEALKKCQQEGDNMLENPDDYSLLVMPYGGVDIETYVTNIKKTPVSANKLAPFWLEFLRMLEGCQVFLKHDIINYDIKPQNILYDDSHKRMNYVDFGIMQSYKTVVRELNQSKFWLAKHAHWSSPLYIQFLNKNRYEAFCSKTEKEKIEFYTKIVHDINSDKDTYNTESIKTILSYIVPNHNKTEFLNAYFNDILNMLLYDICAKSYNEFIRKSLNTIDIYGVGFTILFATIMLQDTISKELYTDLFSFSYRLITPRIYDTYTCSEAIVKYRELLVKHGLYEKPKFMTLSRSIRGLSYKTLFTRKKRDKIK